MRHLRASSPFPIPPLPTAAGMVSAARLVGLLLLAVAPGLACRGGGAERVAFDLGAGLPFADVRKELSSIDLGSHGNRWHLAQGWAAESWHRRQATMFALQGAPEATLKFRMADPAAVVLRLQGRPFGDWEPEHARFQVKVNGRIVGSAAVRRELKWYDFEVPAVALVPGTNELTIRWTAVTGDGSPPTFGWFELRVERRVEERLASPRYRADESTLLLPANVRLDYHLRVPEAAVLRLDRLSLGSGTGGELAVELVEDGVDPVLLGRFPAPRRGVRLDLGEYGGRVVRLSLEATGASDAATFSGLAVEAPVVVTTEPEPPGTRSRALDSSDATPASTARAGRRNVIVYVVDTLRRDHLGVYGYRRPVSPELDRFAADATTFENAVGQSSWTRASMASVFTGLWPMSHATNGRKDVLAPEAETLAELLQRQGYLTMAIVLNHNVFPVFGFAQGFENYTKMTRGGAAKATDTFLGWLDRRADERPFFAWLHPVDPHDPYVPPPEFRELFDDLDGEPLELKRPPTREDTTDWSPQRMARVVRHLTNLYDAEIAANDRSFGRLLSGLEERGLLEETMIVFVSDHGEEFQEHGGWTHGHNLNSETLDIPLVIRFPDRGRGERVDDVVQHIDILPTILDYLGIAVPGHVEGRSLLPLVGSPDDADRRQVPAFSFVDLEGRPHLAVVDGDWKLIERLEGPGEVLTRLFDRSEDPGETRNLALERPVLARYLERLIEARAREERLLTTSEAELDEETENALRALGYLQ